MFEFDLFWLLSLRKKTFTVVLFLITIFNLQNQFDSCMNSSFSYQKCLMKSMLFFRDTKSSQYFVKKDQKLWHDYWNFRIKADFSKKLSFHFFRYFNKNIFCSWKFWNMNIPYTQLPMWHNIKPKSITYMVISIIELFSKI